MNILKNTIVAFSVATLAISCNNDDDNTTSQPVVLEMQTVTNLHAEQTSDYTVNPPVIGGDFVKFDFSTGATTTSNDDWDIAFRGTTILVNGGAANGLTNEPARTGNAAAYIADGTFADITSVNISSFVQDSAENLAIPTGSGNGWYLYDATTHVISPTAGKVLVFRTQDGKYAKVEILSYYKNTDTSDYNNAQYYTFNYVYQPNDSTDF